VSVGTEEELDLLGLEMVPRACPVCGSVDDAVVVAEQRFDPAVVGSFGFASRKQPEYMHYRLVACPACDLVFANPAPRAEALAEAYREAAYDSGEEAGLAARTYAGFLPEIRERLVRTGGAAAAALDIGAGDGAFLEQLVAAGFSDAVGVEPSEAPRRAAKAGIRPLIREGIFSGEAFTGQSFDLVTCFQTIEHVHDPLQLLRALHALLRPGGAVLVVCHNRRAVSARLLGRRSPIYDIEHLQLFSPKSMALALRRAGFGDVEVRRVVNRYPLRYWARLFPFPPVVKPAVQAALSATRLGAARMPLPAGNIAALAYKP
jgi:SAM-dependent methyltransferase